MPITGKRKWRVGKRHIKTKVKHVRGFPPSQEGQCKSRKVIYLVLSQWTIQVKIIKALKAIAKVLVYKHCFC